MQKRTRRDVSCFSSRQSTKKYQQPNTTGLPDKNTKLLSIDIDDNGIIRTLRKCNLLLKLVSQKVAQLKRETGLRHEANWLNTVKMTVVGSTEKRLKKDIKAFRKTIKCQKNNRTR
jgi:hypothetical protein